MKLHLVDATFELFRAYYSRPPRRAPDGRPVSAVQGLLDSMLSLLREPDERKRRHKAYALLARNGFDPEVCREAATAFSDGGTSERG